MKLRDRERLRRWRIKKRAGLSLEDRALKASTRSRYYEGVLKVLPLLTRKGLDNIISEWIEDEYSAGAGVTSIADTLSGLHHFAPYWKGRLRRSWKLYRLWRKLERPAQAPPFPQEFVESLVARAIELGDLSFALTLALGFWGMLRTGELMTLRADQIMLGKRDLVIQLGYTKTGTRRQQDENVVVHRKPTILLAESVLERRLGRGRLSRFLYTRGPIHFRKHFKSSLALFGMGKQFRPYSLRRGGATAHFRRYGQMERTLIRGRWTTNQAARQYIQEGLSTLAKLQIDQKTHDLLRAYSPLFTC
eukprot:Skav207215  [mRNA]  locus=scaffold1244:133523:134437:+ [translate_table: standard]